MKTFTTPFALAAALVCLSQVPAAGFTYACKMTKEAIQIDGVLSERTWTQADTMTYVDNATGAAIVAPVQGTRVSAAWDSAYLYLAFVTQDKDVKGVYRNHDDQLWNVESVEMFIDVDSDQSTYLEFEWNCLNTTWDGLLKYANGAVTVDDPSWNPAGVVSAVKVRGTPDMSSDADTGMTVETKIPWKSLDTNMTGKISLPPKNGDQMRVNFYRLDRRTVNGATVLDATAWTPTLNSNFHTPGKFGTIVFSTQVPSAVSSPPSFRSSGVPYVLGVTTDGIVRISYTLDKAADVRLEVFTMEGREITSLERGVQGPGPHQSTWNGMDACGRSVKNGAYCLRLVLTDGNWAIPRLIGVVR